MALVYKATCRVNGKSYVGFTVNSLNLRRQQHESAARSSVNHCRLLCRALRKHGQESFDWEVLFEGTYDDALAFEPTAIFFANSLAPAGYNLTRGGESPEVSKVSRQKISDSRRGKPLSLSHRKTLSLVRTGKTRSPEATRKAAAKLIGRPRPESVRRALRLSRGGLTDAEIVAVAFCVSLGAVQARVAEWFDVSTASIERAWRQARGR